MRFHEVRTKSALNHVRAGTRGCRSSGRSTRTAAAPMPACTASPARRTSTWSWTRGGTSSARSSSRSTCPRCCARSSRGRRGAGDPIALGTNTDPYQWVEGRYKLMRGIWEVMRDFRNPCSILTKSPLAAARPGPAAGDRGGDGRQRVPVGADAGREGLAGDRAAHAEPEGAAGGGGGAQPHRHPDRRPDRPADARRQRRARAGGADRRGGDRGATRPTSAARRCSCAARCARSTSTGCASTGRTSCRATSGCTPRARTSRRPSKRRIELDGGRAVGAATYPDRQRHRRPRARLSPAARRRGSPRGACFDPAATRTPRRAARRAAQRGCTATERWCSA